MVVRNVLLADSDDLNLAQQLLGQLLHGHAGTSGLAGEILAVHAVESSEVFHVSQEAGGLDDVLEAQAVSSQNGLDALAGALSLLLDGGADDLTGTGHQGDLAGSKQEAVGGDSLRIGADCGGGIGSVGVIHNEVLPFQIVSC